MRAANTEAEIHAADFGRLEFINRNKDFFNDYVELRVKGRFPRRAFRQVFGPHIDFEPLDSLDVIAAYIERSAWFQRAYAKRQETIPMHALFNVRDAVEMLTELAYNPKATDSVRLEAYKELALITGLSDGYQSSDGTRRVRGIQRRALRMPGTN